MALKRNFWFALDLYFSFWCDDLVVGHAFAKLELTGCFLWCADLYSGY